VTICPVAGSSGICPDVYSRFPTFTACEYGPIAAGAASVEIACFVAVIAALSCTLSAIRPLS
jgi:hypothetical protein